MNDRWSTSYFGLWGDGWGFSLVHSPSLRKESAMRLIDWHQERSREPGCKDRRSRFGVGKGTGWIGWSSGSVPLVGHPPPVGCANKMKQAIWNKWFLSLYSGRVYVCICVWEKDREIEIETDTETQRYRHRGMGWRSVQFSRSVVSDSLQPHGLQHTRPPCPSPIPGVYSNSCPLSGWCHPAISSSVVPFSSCTHSLPASGSFPMSQLFASGGQSIGVSASASVLPMNTQDWSPLGWTSWISLQSKGLSRVFFNTSVQKHQFFCIQLSL